MIKIVEMEATKKILENDEEKRGNFPFYIILEHLDMCTHKVIHGKVFTHKTILLPFFSLLSLI